MNYERVIKDCVSTINAIGEPKSGKDRRAVAELYNIYYNAVAGVLRGGALYSKSMGKDGYTEISVSVGPDVYTCRENVLRDILKEDYITLTSYPYEDTSLSFVKPYVHTESDPFFVQPAAKDAKEKEAEKEKRDEKALIEETRKANEATLREKNRQLKKAAKRFKYNPDYDHNYDDKLPELQKELSRRGGLIAKRIACIVIAGAILLLSLIFL